ncbi:hypothetical protein ACFLZP_02355, partial [Patescibacteria group bacterium]
MTETITRVTEVEGGLVGQFDRYGVPQHLRHEGSGVDHSTPEGWTLYTELQDWILLFHEGSRLNRWFKAAIQDPYSDVNIPLASLVSSGERQEQVAADQILLNLYGGGLCSETTLGFMQGTIKRESAHFYDGVDLFLVACKADLRYLNRRDELTPAELQRGKLLRQIGIAGVNRYRYPGKPVILPTVLSKWTKPIEQIIEEA